MYFSTTDDSIDLDKIHSDIAFLHQSFTSMLRESGEGAVADLIDGKEQAHVSPEKLTKAFSLYFQFLTIAEENAGVQLRRKLEKEHGLSRISGLWGNVFELLKKRGVSEQQIAQMLPSIKVEPVLTAHPTESKRSTMIDQLRSIYLLMVKRENAVWTLGELAQIKEEIKAAMQRLWLSGQVYLQKPSIEDELRNVMHYLSNVFPEVLPLLDQRLREAWSEAGFNEDYLNDPQHYPSLQFGDWVGGDRDGHPFVTAEVTKDTLFKLRKAALLLVRKHLSQLARRLSLSVREVVVPEILQQQLQQMADSLPKETAKKAIQRNPNEPWRQFLNLLQVKLPLDEQDEPLQRASDPSYFMREEELLNALSVLRKSLLEIGAHRVVAADVDPVIRKVQTFGFHLAALDVRQNSAFHDKAMSQLLVAAGVEDGQHFADWSEEKRLAFLNEELKSPRPFLRYHENLGQEAEAVLKVYRVLHKYNKHFGHKGLGSLIISMTRSLSDMLVVYTLAREAGLTHFDTEKGLACILPVVPLLETIEDLEAGPQILEAFITHPVTQNSYDLMDRSDGQAVQQVMVGYSDSNKDGGIVASLWSLNVAQRKLTAVGKKHLVRIRYFHGRGGTISRGAGPTHRFIAGLPTGTIGGDLRLTEQGEVIAQKYANRITALYNLELLQAGTLGLSLGAYQPLDASGQDQYKVLEPIINKVYENSLNAYQALVKNDDFVRFFAEATPIDVIESSSIGSRPARRTGKRSFGDLRAIPWVFSWSQSRFFITGWYGLGSALTQLRDEDPEAFELLRQGAISFYPFRYIITNASSGLAWTDEEIMREYSHLVSDKSLATKYMDLISSEYHRTKEMLEILYGQPLNERRSRMYTMIEERSARMRPLHALQISQIREWRALKADGKEEEAARKLPEMLLVLNAIAGGMGSTG